MTTYILQKKIDEYLRQRMTIQHLYLSIFIQENLAYNPYLSSLSEKISLLFSTLMLLVGYRWRVIHGWGKSLLWLSRGFVRVIRSLFRALFHQESILSWRDLVEGIPMLMLVDLPLVLVAHFWCTKSILSVPAILELSQGGIYWELHSILYGRASIRW